MFFHQMDDFDNFRVLGFVCAESELAAFDKLKEEYHYLKGSGFDEVWFYQIALLSFIVDFRVGMTIHKRRIYP